MDKVQYQTDMHGDLRSGGQRGKTGSTKSFKRQVDVAGNFGEGVVVQRTAVGEELLKDGGLLWCRKFYGGFAKGVDGQGDLNGGAYL